MKHYLLFIFILGLFALSLTKVNAQTVFINEIHYDNTGTDTGEAVEIAGPAGTDLTGWKIQPYNGNGGAPYTPVGNFSGVIPNLYNGYGTVSVLISGLQNGSPDGIALIDNSDNVIQFLSYEGTFTAVGGPANGMMSIDIGVSELGGGAVGNSLQLSGTGAVYTDFAWQAEAPNTFGAVNTGQTFSGVPAPLVVVINEFSASTVGTDVEYIEIKSNPNTDLSEYSVLEIEGDAGGGVIDAVIALGTTDANGYYLADLAANVLENGSLTLVLVKNFTGTSGEDLDTNDDGVFDLIPWDEIVDDVAVYDGGSTDISYSSSILSPNYDGVSTYAPGGASRIPDGTDTDAASDWVRNDFDLYGIPGFTGSPVVGEAVNTPGAENQIYVVTEPVSLIINEILYDPCSTCDPNQDGTPNTTQDEFVELVNVSGSDLDISSWTISDGVGVRHIFPANTVVPSLGSIVVFGGGSPSGNFGGSLVQTASTGALGLNNTGDDVIVKNGDNIVAEYSYGGSIQDESITRNQDITGTDFVPHSSVSSALYSPGTKADGTNFDGNKIPVNELISIAEARAAAGGTTVTITGTLTVTDQFAGSAYMQDATAGIAVYDAQVYGPGLYSIGDSITITGTISFYKGLVEVTSLTSVTDHGPANNPIVPLQITLAEMAGHPSELVKVLDASFPSPNNLLFGNNNYLLTDASGSGEMRLDADVDSLIGLAQPTICEVTGVVSRYDTIYQLMPRMKADLPCADKYIAEDGLEISKDATLDIATWNIEWFGDEGTFSPADDEVQKDSVKAVLLALDADIIGVEEVSDAALLAQMVSEMPGYDFVLSDATSYPEDNDVDAQKIGFIYKTATITPVSTKVLLKTVHPYYNGGDDSMLGDFPDADKTRFFASGRLPFMLTADVTINGVTERISFIDLHARANTTPYEEKYEMRKYDVEALKDTLDEYYSDQKIVMVGDYNDDVDETVADVSTTISTYQAYVDDAAHYSFPTRALSDADFRSYVTYPNMIDHVMLSDELFASYIDGSAQVHYEFYDSDYTSTTSDHFPVSVRLKMNLEMSLCEDQVVYPAYPDSACATLSVAFINAGEGDYSYEWSTGETTETINVCPETDSVFYLTLTYENNYSVTDSVNVTAIDVSCTTGNGSEKVELCFNGHSICVAVNAVDEHLRNGATLGACTEEEVQLVSLDDFKVYPNPFDKKVTVSFISDEKTDGTLYVIAETGVSAYTRNLAIHEGYNTIDLNLSSLITGTYVVVVSGSNIVPLTQTIIKQ